MESTTSLDNSSGDGVRMSWRRSAWMVGVILFIGSFLAPTRLDFLENFDFLAGLSAFINTPIISLDTFSRGVDETNSQLFLVGLSLAVGWAANFTIFFRLPAPVAFLAVIAPWVLYLTMTFFGTTTGDIDTTVPKFFPFYPWAFGIALIHVSRLFEIRPNPERRTPWTGF